MTNNEKIERLEQELECLRRYDEDECNKDCDCCRLKDDNIADTRLYESLKWAIPILKEEK